MDLLAYAVPGFLVLILIEVAAGWYTGKSFYRANDVFSNVGIGILSVTVPVAITGIDTLAYAVASDRLAPIHLEESIWTWTLGMVLYDLCFYWSHRCGHRINMLWASHAVHHQSEDFNLSTAFRLPPTGPLLFNWFFYLPILLLGIPMRVFVVSGTLSLIYQFWIHSQYIGKIPWMDRVFMTPSNHRVHHAINDTYIDKNYGAILVVWDRMFGTYQPEIEGHPIRYGTLTPIRSWNPLWANVHLYVSLAKDAWSTRSWWDRVRIWWMPTGWRPSDVASHPAHASAEEPKFDLRSSRLAVWYCVTQYAVLLGGASAVMVVGHSLGWIDLWTLCLLLWFGAYSLSMVAEGRTFAPRLEAARILASAGALWVWIS